MERLGYRYDYRILDSADYGAHTSRPRYYGVFALEGLPIRWPSPTHRDPRKPTSLYNAAPNPGAPPATSSTWATTGRASSTARSHSHGFQPFDDRDDYPKRLYIPLSLVRKAFEAR